jgi:hypothetical protein
VTASTVPCHQPVTPRECQPYAAVLLKTLPLIGDDALRAAVVRHPHHIPAAGMRALVAASGGAVTQRPMDVVCAAGAVQDARVDLGATLPGAVFVERRAATTTTDGGSDGAGAAGAAAPLGTLLSDRVAAVEAEDGVVGPPEWLSEHAPVFYQRVAFVHDTNSKQIVQRVEGVTKQVESARAAAASAAEDEAAAAAAAALDDETAAAAAAAKGAAAKRTAAATGVGAGASSAGAVGASSSLPSPPQQATTSAAAAAAAPAPAPAPALAPSVAETSETPVISWTSGAPVIYVAKRPFHPGRLAALLRRHFTLTTESVSDGEGSGGGGEGSRGGGGAMTMTGGGGGADNVTVAADAAARAAAAAAAAAEAMMARLSDSLGDSSSRVDPALLAASAVVTSSSAAAAAATAAAAAAAHLLSRLLSSPSSHPGAVTMQNNTSAPAAAPAAASGPFSGVTCSAGVVWIASRPALCGVWTQPNPDRAGAINVACAGGWDRDASASCALALAAPAAAPAATLTVVDQTNAIPRGGTFLGERRQELVFEGSEGMNHAALRAALDECLLTEHELSAAATAAAAAMGKLSAAAGGLVWDSGGLCFVPWPEQVLHLASLGVTIGGRGSRVITQAAKARHGWNGRSRAGPKLPSFIVCMVTLPATPTSSNAYGHVNQNVKPVFLLFFLYPAQRRGGRRRGRDPDYRPGGWHVQAEHRRRRVLVRSIRRSD